MVSNWEVCDWSVKMVSSGFQKFLSILDCVCKGHFCRQLRAWGQDRLFLNYFFHQFPRRGVVTDL